MTPTQRPKTVLVIDDDAIVRLMVSEALSDAGYDVVEAGDAESGVKRFAEGGADLVLLDVLLPGMNGFEACLRLRALPAGADVPIIVMTGLGDRSSIDSAYDSGATDFITKPIVWDLLPYRVRYALRASESFQESLRTRALLSRSQSLAGMGSWEWRREDDALRCSDELHRILGGASRPPGLSARAALVAHVHPDDRAMVDSALADAMERGLAFNLEYRIVRADGTERRLVEQTSVECLADQTVVAIYGIRRDITEQVETSERIRALAFFDPLTGLANRSLFRNMVQLQLASGVQPGQHCAVLVVDIDRFKLINQTLGTQVGDEVLKTVAHRLCDSVKNADPAGAARQAPAEERTARLGGDEFAVLLCDLTDPQQAHQVAQCIVRALDAPIQVGGHDVSVGACIGISIMPDDGRDTDALMKHASTALQAAKDDLQQRIRFYDGAMSAAIGHKAAVEADLRRAIQQGQLRLHYQAKVDTRTLQVVGAEALIRWLHPTRGLVGPNEFIPIAEESGLITPITQWVIEEACRQLGAWRSEGQRMVPVSINLDAWSLQSLHLAASVEAALQSQGLPSSAIEFEVTESNLLRDMNQACQTLQSLRDLGIRLSIDDFGTGYSSLTYLKRFPVDVIKIDRSFIKDLPANSNDAALTSAVIAMGHSLDIALVAEGVETWAQVEFLMARGCHLVQGFLFSRPVPAKDFVALVAQGLNVVPAPCPAVALAMAATTEARPAERRAGGRAAGRPGASLQDPTPGHGLA